MESKEVPNHFNCDHCNVTLGNQDLLEIHMTTVHNFMKCEICSKLLANKNLLACHKYREHRSKCVYCGKVLGSKKLLNQHCLEKHGKLEASCHICKEIFSSQSLLTSHMVTVHNFIQCKVCPHTFADKLKVAAHEFKQHRLKCDYCDEVLKSKKLFDKHCLEKHSASDTKCQVCYKTLTTESLLASHMVTEHKFIKCEICPRFFADRIKAADHKFKKHRLKCEHCDEVLKSKRALDIHCLEKHPAQHGTQHKCQICNEVLGNQDVVDSHLIADHKFIRCDSCPKVFANGEWLAIHKLKSHPLKCEHCEEVLKSKASLDQHYSEKHADQNVTCQVCSEVLENHILLDNYMIKVHKFIKCKMCPNSYAYKKLLGSHMFRRHPLKCEHCDSTFDTRKKLTQHRLQSHSTEKVTCHVCNAVLGNQVLLNSHLMTVHEFIKCKMCPEVFANKKALGNHKQRNHRLKCEYCDEVLESNELLRQHVDEKHKGCSDSVLEDDYPIESGEDSMSVDSFEVGKYDCTECGASFETFHGLEYHKKEHIPRLDHLNETITQCDMEVKKEGLLQCSICCAVFELSDDLEKHSKDHIIKNSLCSG